MFRDILAEAQQIVLELLSRVGEVRTFYLAGGTALALHLGHRRSGDFDFFRGKDFLPQDLLSSLRETGMVRVLQEATGTLTVMLREVPTSFFRYDYPLLRPLHESPWSLSLADPEDIAAMKLLAETEGIWAETAGGVTVAVAQKLIAQGRIDRDGSTVLCITGNGLKTQDAVAGAVEQPAVIKPSLKEFEPLVAEPVLV